MLDVGVPHRTKIMGKVCAMQLTLREWPGEE